MKKLTDKQIGRADKINLVVFRVLAIAIFILGIGTLVIYLVTPEMRANKDILPKVIGFAVVSVIMAAVFLYKAQKKDKPK